MDKLDRQIYSELRRLGYQQRHLIADQLHKHPRTISRRIKRMIDKEIITIIAVPNPNKFGFNSFAHILIAAKPKSVDTVADQLIEHPLTRFVASCIGRFHLAITVAFKNTTQLRQFYDQELASIKGIKYAEIVFVERLRKYYHFDFTEPIKPDSSYSPKDIINESLPQVPLKLDKEDRIIIKTLTGNALTNIQSIKSNLNIRESAIRKRIKRMLDDELIKFEVIPNLLVLKEMLWVIIEVKTDITSVYKVMDLSISITPLLCERTPLINVLSESRPWNEPNITILCLPKVDAIAYTSGLSIDKSITL